MNTKLGTLVCFSTVFLLVSAACAEPNKVLLARLKSAVNTLWDECESCHATGKVGPLPCRECAGFGWKLYA